MTVDLTSDTGLGSLGPRIVAQIIGTPYQQYRPNGVTAPIVSGNLLTITPAWITNDPGLMAKTGSLPAKPVRYAAVDPNIINPGDYLVGALGTLFILSQNLPEPINLVYCNRTVSITRQPATITPGAAANYGGDVAQNETVVITGWPASVLMLGTRSSSGTLQLPSEGKQGVVQVLLPNTVPVTILEDDIITDDFGKRYEVSSAELTAVGWRLNAEEWEV